MDKSKQINFEFADWNNLLLFFSSTHSPMKDQKLKRKKVWSWETRKSQNPFFAQIVDISNGIHD